VEIETRVKRRPERVGPLVAAIGGLYPRRMAEAPPWLSHHDELDDADRYAAMTPEERLQYFVEVSELARTILEARSDRAAVLNRVDPLPPLAEATWRRLVREARERTAR
jgi:hypothetical protein